MADLLNDGLEDLCISFVVHTLPQGAIHRVVLSGPHAHIPQVPGSREEVPVFVKGNGHDPVCEIEGLWSMGRERRKKDQS